MASIANRRRRVSRRENQSMSMEQAATDARGIAEEALEYVRDYVRAKPENAALWCLGIGFVLGWKLKPW
jgi:hypothetical protein